MWMEAGPLVCTHAFVQTLEEEKKTKQLRCRVDSETSWFRIRFRT